jgi:transcription initiation factor TFIID subunit 2
MTFKSYYKTKPKVPLVLEDTAPAEPPRPPPLAKTSSIKISMKQSGTPRPSAPATPNPVSGIIAVDTPAIQQKSNGLPKAAGSPNTPSQPLSKRPLSEQDSATATPVAKRTKTDMLKAAVPKAGTPKPSIPKPSTPKPSSPYPGHSKKSRIVTLTTRHRKQLASILGKSWPPPASSARTALPSGGKKETTPNESKDSIVVKARKPLPSGGDTVRKPLPTGGSSMSPPPQQPAKMTVNTHVTPAPAGKSSSPPVGTPTSAASNRPKIKIIRKPQPQATSQSPPAP